MQKRKRGRPSRYTPEAAEKICNRLANGESLNGICKDKDMPSESAVRSWADTDAEFGAKYARARNIGLDCQADAMLEVARDKSRDPRCRAVEIDALKWRLCKLAPKRYGDKVTSEVSGPDGGPVPVEITIKFPDGNSNS